MGSRLWSRMGSRKGSRMGGPERGAHVLSTPTPITGQPSSSPVMSSIFSHINTTGHSDNFDDFKILSSCSDTCELLIHESLFISKLKPSLTVQGPVV
jgi:hypothetical protein